MFHLKEYKELVKSDQILLATTRNKEYPLKFSDRSTPEARLTRLFRFVQVNKDNIIGKVLSRTFLRRMGYKYGISLSRSNVIGPGLLIGHWGRIIINGDAVIGDDFAVSCGVVIGMDMRGKRKGTPTIGNRVCIHSNSCVVGNITVGDDVVIAPNTFVNFDVPSHSVVVGNPAVIHPRENATEGYIGEHFIKDTE